MEKSPISGRKRLAGAIRQFKSSKLLMIAGLTGGISTGKSSASNYLKSLGAAVIDCDLIAREVVVPGSPGYNEIVKYFGPSILLVGEEHSPAKLRSIDRKKLGSLIFGESPQNVTRRKKLNSITHPKIRKRIFIQLLFRLITLKPLIIIDAPLLFESGLGKLMPTTLLITCSPAIQLHRLMNRDKIGRQEAFNKITSQMLLSEKQKRATTTIWNNSTLGEMHHSLRIWAEPMIQKGRFIQLIVLLIFSLFFWLIFL